MSRAHLVLYWKLFHQFNRKSSLCIGEFVFQEKFIYHQKMIPAGVIRDSTPLTTDITSDMGCQTVPDLLGFTQLTSGITAVTLHVMEWKVCLALL